MLEVKGLIEARKRRVEWKIAYVGFTEHAKVTMMLGIEVCDTRKRLRV
jgi:hypothetical protein